MYIGFYVILYVKMNELQQLKELNEGLQRVEHTVNKLRDAMIGDEFNTNGIIHRVDSIETKLKKLERFTYILIGVLSMGTIPLGSAILPHLKNLIKL